MEKQKPVSWRWQAALIVLPVVLLAVLGTIGLFQIQRVVLEQETAKAQDLCDRRERELKSSVDFLLRQHPVPALFDDPPELPEVAKAVEVEELKQAMASEPQRDLKNHFPDRWPYRTRAGLPTHLLLKFQEHQQATSDEERGRRAEGLRFMALFEEASVISPSLLSTIDPENRTEWRAEWEHTCRAQKILREGPLPLQAWDRWAWKTEPSEPGAGPYDERFWLIGRGDYGLAMVDSDLLVKTVTAKIKQNRMFRNSSVSSPKLKRLGDPIAIIDERTYRADGVGLSVYLGGRRTGSFRLANSIFERAVLAISGERGELQVVAIVHEAEPLLAQQRQLTWWFIAVVGASIVCAVVGLWMLRCTMLRERALSDMKTNFVASVTHELRAPVASLQLLAEGLEAGTVSSESKRGDYFRLMVEECRRLGGLIANVLDLSRIERGRREFSMEETDLGALVRDTVKLHEPRATSLGIALKCETQELDPPAVVDALALQQALTNLLDNALKFAPKDSSVIVRLEQPDAKNWRLSVVDCGPGVPATEQTRIFDTFHRAGSEMRRETQGVGIGLAIVRHMVEAHQGKVWVESEPNHATRFIIEGPLA